ncbi:MAG: TetR/AcrR family transcriptional regulator [Alphaproteobacteria bacterium]|nr:TetR/AcrR family transcriptional regulator [Alphaproteobacteria bacterium]
MTPVNEKRAYRSRLRAEQAEHTRETVIARAAELFVAEGWHKATIAGIARQAGVSPETIYAVFGNKRALLEAVIARAVRGASPDTPLLEQAGPAGVASAPTQAAQIARFATDITGVLSRVATLMDVVRSAARADAEMRTLLDNLHAGRRRNLKFLVDALLTRGPLRTGLGSDDALDTVWRLCSPELFLFMRDIEGRAPEAYRDWLDKCLGELLLDRP